MRRSISIAFAIIIMVVPAVASAKAVLIDASGDVKVTHAGGRRVVATVGLELADGSIVTVGDGGKASLLAESGALEEVAAGSTYTVGKGGGAAKSTNLGRGIALAMKEITASGEGPTVHGMVKKVEGPRGKLGSIGGSGNMLVGTYPVGTAVILGPTITFKWSRPIGGAWQKPAIVVEDATKRRLAVKAVSKSKTSYEGTQHELKVNKGHDYSWYFASTQGGVKGASARFAFSTLSAKRESGLDSERKKIDRLRLGADGTALLMAQLYYKYNLMDDMVRTLAPIYAKTPSSFMKRLLYNGYARMGRMTEAAKYE